MDKKNITKKNAERNNFGKNNNFKKPDRQKPVEAATDEEKELICGRNPVIEALRSGAEINKVLLQEGMEPAKAAQIIELCRERKVVYASVPKQQLIKLAGADNRGVIAYLAPFAYAEPEEMLALAAERGEAPFIVLLDGVEDPHNLGAIIRTALCTGAHGVIIPKRRSAALTQTVNKVSSGALQYMKVARVSNLVQTIESLKKAGLWIAGADMDGENIYQANLKSAMGLVMGAEGKGLSPLVREKCDFIISLPMKGPLNSLSVSAAGAVCMYEIMKANS